MCEMAMGSLTQKKTKLKKRVQKEDRIPLSFPLNKAVLSNMKKKIIIKWHILYVKLHLQIDDVVFVLYVIFTYPQ